MEGKLPLQIWILHVEARSGWAFSFPGNMNPMIDSNSFSQAEKKVYARLDAHVQRKRQGQDVTLVVTGHLGAIVLLGKAIGFSDGI